MSSGEALLREICQNPGDDDPRLIFADWLEDYGDPHRADLIRVQVRLGKIRQAIPPPDEGALFSPFALSRSPGGWHCPGDSPERRELAYRGRGLLDAHEEQWLAPVRGMLRREWTWSRGFVEVVDVEPASLAASADELFGRHPIRRLILSGLKGKADLLAAIPADNCLASLDLILNDLDLKALRELTRMRHLDRLTELNLSFNGLRDSAIDFLCGEPFFQNLSLGLCCNPFTDGGRQRLRDHFGPRARFERKRYPDRLFTLSTNPRQTGAGPTAIHPQHMGTASLHAGWGGDRVQLLLEELADSNTLTVFDHAGDLLQVETRSCWEKQEAQRREEKEAWLQCLGYQSAEIRVKRFPGVYDFPKSWSDLFDCSDAEPEEYAAAVAFMERWLAEDGFRYGSFCGGWWLNRKSGQPIAP